MQSDALDEDHAADTLVSSDVDLLQEVNREAGWQVEYRQLEPGPLRTVCRLRELDGLSILYECSDRRLELAAQPPDGMVSVVVPAVPNRMSFNGSSMELGSFGVFTPGAELIGVTQGPADAWSLQIPADVFARRARSLAPDRALVGSSRAHIVRTVSRYIHAPSRATRGSLGLRRREPRRARVRGGFRRHCGSPFRRHLPGPESRSATPLATSEILRIAREYIEGILDRPIRMADVFLAAGTSLSTLERIFDEGDSFRLQLLLNGTSHMAEI